MKRMNWWTLVGVTGAGLAASLLGQSVWGQIGERRLPPPLPTIVSDPTSKPTDLPAPEPRNVGVNPPEQKTIPALPPINDGPGYTALPPISSQDSTPPVLVTRGAEQKIDRDLLTVSGVELRPGRQQPSVSIEWVAPQVARIHQPMACQLLVRNISSSPVSNVIVRQRLPQGVVCKLTEPQAANEAGELVWNLGALAPEQTRRISLNLVSEMRGPVNCQANVTFTGAVTHQVQVREPMLAIKMRAPDKTIAGEPVNLLFAISNPGDGVAESVKVKVTLPEGLEHSRGKIIEVDVTNLAPKEVRTMQLICLAKGSGPQKCSVVTTAEGGVSAEDSVQVDILMPKLDVALTGPKLRYLDRHAVYTAKIVNPGSATATNVEVNQILPAGFKFHQAGQGGQYKEATRTVSWSIGDLQPGQSKEIMIDVIPVEPGEHRLITHARSARGLKTEAEAYTVVEGLPSLLIELADLDDPIEVGADTAYELHVTNSGTKTESNVEVVCMLPEQFEFKGAKCSTTLRYRIEGREVIFEPLPKLAPKADVIYRIQVRGNAPGDVRFRARIRTDDMKEPIVREERTRIYSDDAPTRSPVSVVSPVVPAANGVSSPAPLPPITGSPTEAPRSLPATSLPPVPGPMPAPIPLPPPPVPSVLPQPVDIPAPRNE